MVQVPPPAMQRSFSDWMAQLKACVTSVPVSLAASGAVLGGWQVALVKESTRRRTK